MEIINELELQKANLEKAYKDKEELANAIANDIALMEQLINAKQEYNKVRNELASIAEKYKVVLAKLHNEHEKIVEQEEKEMKE